MLAAIDNGQIPYGSLIITKDTNELYFLDMNGALKEIAGSYSGQASVLNYNTHLEFPNIGSESMLYIAKAENNGNGLVYRWDEQEKKYFTPIERIEDIKAIHGGNAFD